MTDLSGPAPEEMQVGEKYEVVRDKKHGGLRLEKAGSKSPREAKPDYYDVEFQLGPLHFFTACIQAYKEGLTYDRWIKRTITDMLDQIYHDGPAKY